MSKRRVVVTGMGIVSPFGVGKELFWNSLVEGKSGISTIERISLDGHTVHIAGEVKNFVPEEYMDSKDAKRMDRYTQFAMVAADEAIADSGIVAGENVDPYRYGVIVGSAAGGFDTFEKQHHILRIWAPAESLSNMAQKASTNQL